MEVHIKIRLFRYTDTQLVCYAYSRFQKNVAELGFFQSSIKNLIGKLSIAGRISYGAFRDCDPPPPSHAGKCGLYTP